MTAAAADTLERRFDLVRELVLRDLRVRYRRSLLGVAWSQLAPLVLLLVLSFIFTKVIPLGIPDYPAFVLTGLLVWTAFQSSLTGATESVTQSADLVRRPGFPVDLLPSVTIVSQITHFVIALPVLFIAVVINTGRIPASAALLPALLAVQFLITLGPAYMVAALNVSFRDIGHALAIVLQLWFFATPIFYDEERLLESSFAWAYKANPMARLITAYRDVLVAGLLPDVGVLAVLAAAGAIVGAAGVALYRRRASTFPEEL